MEVHPHRSTDEVQRGSSTGGALDERAVVEGLTPALEGAEAVAGQLVRSLSPLGARFEVADVNGAPGVGVAIDDTVAAVLALGIHHGLIDVIHAVGNPAKLRHLQDPADNG